MLEYPKRKTTMYRKNQQEIALLVITSFHPMRCGASQFKNDCVLNTDKLLFEKGYEQVILNSYFEWFLTVISNGS